MGVRRGKDGVAKAETGMITVAKAIVQVALVAAIVTFVLTEHSTAAIWFTVLLVIS